MKRLVFCFDGTWNALSAETPTNVVLTAASIVRQTQEGITQIIHYDEGVGTGYLETKYEYYTGGILGAGLLINIREAYRFLIFNYDPGDEIFVFGFSRGAFTARSFVGLVRYVGPLRRLYAGLIDKAFDLYRARLENAEGAAEQMRKFRSDYAGRVCVSSEEDEWRCRNVEGYAAGDAPLLKIKYLGLWDTVRALGVADSARALSEPLVLPLDDKHSDDAFHDATISSFVQSARHAVAIDERRALFPVLPLGDLTELNRARNVSPEDLEAPYQEKWFPGTHGSVGGGGDIRGLSDAALNWIIKGAKKAGLVLDKDQDSRIHNFKPDALAPLANMTVPPGGFTYIRMKDREGPQHVWQLSMPAIRRYHHVADELPERTLYRPATLSKVAEELDPYPTANLSKNDAPLLTTHIVVQSDILTVLAKHYYNDPKLANWIFQANLDTLDHPDDLFIDTELRIPLPPKPPPAPEVKVAEAD